MKEGIEVLEGQSAKKWEESISNRDKVVRLEFAINIRKKYINLRFKDTFFDLSKRLDDKSDLIQNLFYISTHHQAIHWQESRWNILTWNYLLLIEICYFLI